MSLQNLNKIYKKRENIKIRLAILGAPGSGKSTMASGLLYYSKLFQFKSDLVPEVAKWDIYKKKNFSQPKYEKDKLNRQKKLEDIFPNDLEILICEAPLIISLVYAEYYLGKDSEITKDVFKMARKYKGRYTHFLVTRKLVDNFENFGRNESEQQSEEIHLKTLEILERLRINYTVINQYDDTVPTQILEMIGAIQKKVEA